MENDEGLKTVECLRGRLLAERQASQTAKQDAELMGNKLMELEKELKEENKLRNKAERRLKLLMKKLESLKLLPTLEENASETTKSDTSHEKSSVVSSSGHQVPKVDDTSSSSLKAPRAEIDNGRNQNYEDGDDDYVDNSLALVPLFLPETKLAPEIKMVSKSVGEVLETLRHARERIQSSMERRQMIRVGPS
ncbi:hypothetical protein HRI_003317200 [Hibiscus trionum]|uniref:Uncharacterized protein n=1 Tax=Hibiscus trionum TaxID=183268 RepID=A0A9W7IGS8_HIBTR|nr:hypothetical protein HRI_003317200 [Hibiscus trionum]